MSNEKTTKDEKVTVGSMTLPTVAGRVIDCSLNTFKLRAKVFIKEEQNKLHPDNRLIVILCDAIRLAREYGDVATAKVKDLD